MKDRNYEVWQPLLLALVLGGGMLLGTRLDDELPLVRKMSVSAQDDDWKELKNVINFIEARYVDSLPVDSISTEIIHELVSKLDPHSYYLHGLDYLHFRERMMGNYEGIGIEFELINDTVRLLKVMPGSPAARSGLMQGDQVLQINGIAVSGMGLSHQGIFEIWKTTKKNFQILIRNRKGQTLEVKVEKGIIKLDSIQASFMLDEVTGLIKIERFSSDTYREFMQHFEGLMDQGLKNLIIDVRNNPGGSLEQVVKILNQLVPERDELLLYTEGLHSRKTEYKTKGEVFYQLNQLAILIDEMSVSASEVLAGSLQDLKKATIIGRRSFGKGLVQEMYQLSEHSALNLTTARYYLPSGRSIQRSYANRTRYEHEHEERLSNGELFETDSFQKHFIKSSPADPRLASLEGIVPDIFVPADTFIYSKQWKNLERQLHQKSFEYFLNNTEVLTDLETENNPKDPEITSMLESLVPDSSQEDLLEQLYGHFKKLVFWHQLDGDAFYEKMAKSDPDVKAALDHFAELVQ